MYTVTMMLPRPYSDYRQKQQCSLEPSEGPYADLAYHSSPWSATHHEPATGHCLLSFGKGNRLTSFNPLPNGVPKETQQTRARYVKDVEPKYFSQLISNDKPLGSMPRKPKTFSR